MKVWKRIQALFLMATMLVAMMPAMALAAEEEPFSDTNVTLTEGSKTVDEPAETPSAEDKGVWDDANMEGTWLWADATGGSPAESVKNPFTDVNKEMYSYNAILWALQEGITSGITETAFGPDMTCTRAQMATFLWRAAGKPEPAGKENPFVDVPADAYYAKAVQWAYEQGITGGTSATTFRPNANCTRAQMAVFLYHMEQAKGGGFTGAWMFRLPFTDTPDWAYEAIAWCYKEGIVSGTSETTFSPNANCTRGQMVTFLYHYFGK